jgi:methylmalonyl-CoA mutase cobalamin-binding subunit/DNA-binding transcriptional MerR regulator
LRVWERRYGFPTPSRNTYGEREYPDAQVSKLKVVRRLLDKGLRPGRILGLPIDDLHALSNSGEAAERSAPQDLALYLLRTHQTVELRKELGQALMRDGLFRFVTETAAPLTELVGDAWMRGELRVFEEHLYTEMLQGLLRGAIAQGAGHGGSPRVLLTTLPSEQHGLGMLMAEAVCTLEGAECVALGPQTPVGDVVAAATAKDVDVVALSFSANFPAGLLSDSLGSLRAALPNGVALWCGGAGVARAKRLPEGVRRLQGLFDIGPAIAEWRTATDPAGVRGG